MKRTFLYGFVASLVLTGLLGIGVLLSGSWSEGSIRVLITTSAFSIYSLLALACAPVWERKSSIFGKVGVFICGLGLVHAIFTTWLTPVDLAFVMTRLSLLIVSIAFAHACLLLLLNMNSAAVKIAVVIAISGSMFNTLIAVVSIHSFSGAMMQTGLLVAIIAIIATVATIAAPVLHLAMRDTRTGSGPAFA